MNKSFFVFENRDASRAYVNALLSAGYIRSDKLKDADFLLYDYERGSGGKREIMEEFLKDKPGFIYPHTPAACFIWDGVYEPLPVMCNFVAGIGQVESMRSYGYPYRVEACGFPRCRVSEFTPTSGKRLLFVPARTRKDGGYASENYKINTPKAFRFILDNIKYFEGVEVCYTNTFDTVGIAQWYDEAIEKGVKFIKTDPYKDVDPAAAMLERIERADLVISCETVGYLSVAIGKPTVFYNAKSPAETLRGQAKNFDKYSGYFSFPLTIEEMTLNDVLNVCKAQNKDVEKWKSNNIGGNFDAQKFIQIVSEYL